MPSFVRFGTQDRAYSPAELWYAYMNPARPPMRPAAYEDGPGILGRTPAGFSISKVYVASQHMLLMLMAYNRQPSGEA